MEPQSYTLKFHAKWERWVQSLFKDNVLMGREGVDAMMPLEVARLHAHIGQATTALVVGQDYLPFLARLAEHTYAIMRAIGGPHIRTKFPPLYSGPYEDAARRQADLHRMVNEVLLATEERAEADADELDRDLPFICLGKLLMAVLYIFDQLGADLNDQAAAAHDL